MFKYVWPVLFTGLTSCASVGQFVGQLFGAYQEKTTKVPYWIYRADLEIQVDGHDFLGSGVTASNGETVFSITSLINVDRIEVETCDREDICQPGSQCPPTFDVDRVWFGQPGKTLRYVYDPSPIERGESCPIHFRVFNKSALLAWGFVAFRNGETLTAKFTCNAQVMSDVGHSACNPKQGKLNTIHFDLPIEDYDVDQSCHLTKLSATDFELRPDVALCTGKFYAQKQWFGMDVVSYQEALVR